MLSNGMDKQIKAELISEDGIDFSQYFRTVRRYLFKILALAVAITTVVILVVLSIKPKYNATASLLIESKQAKVLSIEEVYGLDSSQKEYLQTQFEILRSRVIAEKVVDRLDLVNHPIYSQENTSSGMGSAVSSLRSSIKSALPFLPQTEKVEKTPEQIKAARRNVVVSLFASGLTISPVKNTQVVNISYKSESSAFSALAANTVAEVYIDNYLDAKFDMTAKATTWLNDSLQGLKVKLETAEARLAQFYETEQVVNIDGVVGLAADELQGLSKQLLDAQNNLKQSSAIFEQIKNKNGDITALATLPEVLSHPSIQNINKAQIEAERKVSELSRVYGPKHQKMIAAVARLQSVQESRESHVKSLVSSISANYQTTYESSQNKVLALQAEVQTAKQQYRRLATLDNTRKKLQREVDINQQLYNSFFTRLKETSELGGFESANARVIDAAMPSNVPSSPKKGLIVVASFILSIGFGVVLSIVLEALNSGIRSTEDVERKLGQRMLGIVPWQPHKKKESLALRHFFDSKFHTFSESIRTLRTSLSLLNMERDNKVIMITSSVPKEGKTTVAINISFAMGQMNKVLLIDTDLRRPSVAKQFNLPGFQPGLVNLISGTHELSECIVEDEYSGVHIIPSGTIPANPQELLASSRFQALVEKLREQYEHIIIDTAPTQAVSDAMVVSKVCDSLIYVVRADSTSDKTINSGLNKFLQMGHRVDGVVLSQVDIKSAKRDGEFEGYYDQYGYHTPVPEKVSA